MKVFLKGVYFLYCGKDIVYVGKSNDIYRRIYEHSSGRAKGTKKEFDSWEYFEFEDDISMSKFEEFCISLFNPKYNKDIPHVYFCEKRNTDIDEAKDLYDYMSSTLTNDLDNAFCVPKGTFYSLIENGRIDSKYIIENPWFDIPLLRRIKNDFIIENYEKLKNLRAKMNLD